MGFFPLSQGGLLGKDTGSDLFWLVDDVAKIRFLGLGLGFKFEFELGIVFGGLGLGLNGCLGGSLYRKCINVVILNK